VTGYRNTNDTWHRYDGRTLAPSIAASGRNRCPAASTLSAKPRQVEVFCRFRRWIIGGENLSSGGNPFDFSKYNSSGPEPPSSHSLSDGHPQAPVSGTVADVSFAFGSQQAAVDFAPHHGAAAKAPVVWLAGAIACAVAALVVASGFGGSPALAISAWLLGGPVAIALVACFSLRDTRARTHPLYSAGRSVPWIYRLAVVASLAAVVVSALHIANWAGRL
jgi:hypothetical protein